MEYVSFQAGKYGAGVERDFRCIVYVVEIILSVEYRVSLLL
jgi:hypothetical protein